MTTHYVLIDFENVRVKTLALLKDRDFRVKVFLGPKDAKLPVDLVLAMHELGHHANYVKLATGGSNALDFHIAYYLGKLAAEHKDGHFYIISKDTGFDPLIQHLLAKKIVCKRVASIEELLGQKPIATTSKQPAAPAKPKLTPAKPAAAKPATVLSPTLQAILDNLKARGTARPRKLKTLTSTIKALPLKLSDEQTAQAIKELQVLGNVTVNGVQVSYRW